MGNRGKLTIYVAIILMCLFAPRIGADTVEVENSRSPDGKLSLRVRGSEEGAPLEESYRLKLEVVEEVGGEALAVYDYHGRAKYPYNAKPANLSVLWSPSGKHIALMIRTTKRSWQIFVVALNGKKLESITLPSGIKKAYSMLGVKEGYRVVRERPDKWVNEDTLVVRTRGDARVEGKVIWFEIDINYSISKKKIISSKLVSTASHEG